MPAALPAPPHASPVHASGVQHNFLKTGNLYRPFNVPGRLGASFVSAQTVNDLDWIVGYYVDASNVAHGFVARR